MSLLEKYDQNALARYELTRLQLLQFSKHSYNTEKPEKTVFDRDSLTVTIKISTSNTNEESDRKVSLSIIGSISSCKKCDTDISDFERIVSAATSKITHLNTYYTFEYPISGLTTVNFTTLKQIWVDIKFVGYLTTYTERGKTIDEGSVDGIINLIVEQR